jgi:Spy/CpxP family protein refolding chaperone
MKKRTAIIVTVLALAALTAVPFVYAGPGGHGRSHEGFAAGMIFSHLSHIQEELDLTDAQMAQIKAIFTELHQQNEASRENIHGGLHDAMLALVNNPNDLASAQAALDRQAAAEKQLKQSLLTATSKALNVLTPDQRAELSKLIQERMERHSERRSSRR